MTRESADRVLRDAEATLGKLRGGRAVVLERKGRDAAVLLSARRFRKLIEAAEDAADIAAAREAEKEPGTIPWEQVKREMGLE